MCVYFQVAGEPFHAWLMIEFYQFQMQDGIIIPVCPELCSRGISGCVYLPEAIYLHATHGTWYATARSGSGQPTENYVSKIKKIVKHLQVHFFLNFRLQMYWNTH